MDATDLSGADVVTLQGATAKVSRVRAAVGAIPDPEIPVITIAELGILRDVAVDGERVIVTVTPTYSGCPALDSIRAQIVDVVTELGHEVEVKVVYAPVWTTDWLGVEARRKLDAYGIAPPDQIGDAICPQCRSDETRVISEFGSTACKALLVCNSCREPFDLFKKI